MYRASLKARIMFLDNAEVSVANLLSYLKNSFSYCKNFSSSGNKSSERRLFTNVVKADVFKRYLYYDFIFLSKNILAKKRKKFNFLSKNV